MCHVYLQLTTTLVPSYPVSSVKNVSLFHQALYRHSSGEAEKFVSVCGKFIPDIGNKFCHNQRSFTEDIYDENILAYFLLGRCIAILKEHDFEVWQDRIEKLYSREVDTITTVWLRISSEIRIPIIVKIKKVTFFVDHSVLLRLVVWMSLGS